MPIYEYKCKKCGYIYEKEFKMNDKRPELIKCYCGGVAHRQFICAFKCDAATGGTSFKSSV